MTRYMPLVVVIPVDKLELLRDDPAYLASYEALESSEVVDELREKNGWTVDMLVCGAILGGFAAAVGGLQYQNRGNE